MMAMVIDLSARMYVLFQEKNAHQAPETRFVVMDRTARTEAYQEKEVAQRHVLVEAETDSCEEVAQRHVVEEAGTDSLEEIATNQEKAIVQCHVMKGEEVYFFAEVAAN